MLVTPDNDECRLVSRETHFAIALISVSLYAIVLGLRYKVGGDYQGYADYYQYTDFRISPTDVPFEIGFYWLICILKLFALPTFSLFLVTCAIQMAFMTAWLRRHYFLAPWFFYFYFTTLLVIVSMNIVRQAIAFSILLYAITALLDRNLIRYMVLVLLASTIHASALMFIPLYFILDKEWFSSRRWQVLLLCFAYLSANAVKDMLFDLLPLLSGAALTERFANVQDDLFFETAQSGFSPGLIFVLVSDLVVILASPWLKRRYATLGFRAYYNAFYIGAVFTPIVFYANYLTFSRLVLYFNGFRFVVLSFLLAGVFSKPVKNPWERGVTGILVVGYFGWLQMAISKGAAWCAPFQWVFQ